MKHLGNCTIGIAVGTLVGFTFSAATKIPLGDNPVTDHVMYEMWSALLTLVSIPIAAAFLVLFGAKILKYRELHPLRLIYVAYATLSCPVCGPVFGAGSTSAFELITTITLMGAIGGAFWGFVLKPIKHGGKHGTIHGASGGGDIKVVRDFLAAGEDVNMELSANHQTPLHYAARFGHKEIVELLIAKGANVNAKADVGKTPLDAAIIMKKTETAELLRKHGGKTGEELKAEGK